MMGLKTLNKQFKLKIARESQFLLKKYKNNKKNLQNKARSKKNRKSRLRTEFLEFQINYYIVKHDFGK